VSQDWLAREWIPGDNARAAQGDYEYFETDPHTRADDMYTAAGADAEMSLFTAATDKTLDIVPGTGHVLSLHRSAPTTTAMVASWLENHEAVVPRCQPAAVIASSSSS
jgi:hypothetical protein